ncbi:MAG: hypothetical protein RLZ25_664 [Pseudomonadota bacterium]|jgi:hypothetical protein
MKDAPQSLAERTEGREERPNMIPDTLDLSRSRGGNSNLALENWNPTEAELVEALSKPTVGSKDGSYFVRGPTDTGSRCDAGMPRATVLIIDGDKQIDEDGVLIDGCVHPSLAHEALTELGIRHFIYTSYRHDLTPGFFKWRAVIPCVMLNPHELPAMSNWICDQLQGLGCMVHQVGEMSTWSQAWYFPRVRDEEAEFLFYDGFLEGLEPIGRDKVDAITAAFKAEERKALPESNGRASEKDANSPIGRFNKTHDSLKAWDDLLSRYGFEFDRSEWLNENEAARYLPPDSTSGKAGVNVYRGRDDGELLVYSHNSSFDLGGKACDYFGLYQKLEHGDDLAAAFAAIRAKEDESPKLENEAAFDLRGFSITGQSAALMKEAREAVHILGRFAVLGQITYLYAPPNSGKTLIVLRELCNSLAAGVLKSEDTFYINADDNQQGMLEKLVLAEEYGLQTLVPGYNGFKLNQFKTYLQQMTDGKAALGKVIVLDTVKKVANIMDKKDSTEFGKLLRAFALQGGSVICLAHTNKHKDKEGNLVFAGTADSNDDSDCGYILNIEGYDSLTGTRTVTLVNIKQRGGVAEKCVYTYCARSEASYIDKLNSVTCLEGDEAEAVRAHVSREKRKEDDHDVILLIAGALQDGPANLTEILEECHRHGISRARTKAVLERWRGEDMSRGALWSESRGDKNARIFTVVESRMTDVIPRSGTS